MPRPTCNHCNEFTRSHALRAAAAEAGRGLPAIEPGMPLPAGTGLNRRSFVLRSGLGLLSVYGASRMGLAQLQEGIAMAADDGTGDTVLVTVFADGGWDSLSVLAPVNDNNYRLWRPNLALGVSEGTPFMGDDRLRWHPRAAAFDALHRAGKLTAFPSIGYDGADQSHFTSRHYWEVGELDANARTGWMGRLLDQIGTADNPLQGLSLDGSLSPALATNEVPVAAIEGSSYDLWAPGVWGPAEELMLPAAGSIGSAVAARAAAGGPSPDRGRQIAGAIAEQSITLHDQLEPFGDEVVPPVAYPGGENRFPRSLASLAAMLDEGLPIRCVSISAAGGYDTHDNQEQSFADDIGLTFDSIAAFQADLEARGIADRVLTLVWSEFGRRPHENNLGTDHGAAGAAFLVGTKAKLRMAGEFRGLGDLDEDGNLRHSADFRTVYSSLVEQWFDVEAQLIIPGAESMSRYELVL